MTRFAVLLVLGSLAAASACGRSGATSSATPAPVVRTGLDVFLADPPQVVRGRRVGLVTNHTGLDAQGRTTIDLLHAMPELELVALFGPEHGIRGDAQAGVDIADGKDARTGLPVHSLYGPTEKPTPEMMKGIEALVYDIQDVGVRQYTYESTMVRALEAAAEAKIPVVILDRPNPVTGDIVEGNILERAHESFIGIHPVASRHGLTMGELARYYNDREKIGADLHVVEMEGWKRSMWWDETGLPWTNPSPNIRSLDAAIHYPGTVFLEGVNLSEGRGTDRPFEQTGAPWLKNVDVARAMNDLKLPGVRFEAVDIPVGAPSTGARHYPNQTIKGIRFVITDRDAYRPLAATLRLIDRVRRTHPEFEFSAGSSGRLSITRHAGSNELVEWINAGRLDDLLAKYAREEAAFRELRKPYLLYE